MPPIVFGVVKVWGFFLVRKVGIVKPTGNALKGDYESPDENHQDEDAEGY